jgi:N,N-dimethylformamidase
MTTDPQSLATDEELFGYIDQFTVEPGSLVPLKVSSTIDSVDVQIVRLVHGDQNPSGPGRKEVVQDWGASRIRPGHQIARAGSCAISDPLPAVGEGEWQIEVAFRPNLVDSGAPQAIVALADASDAAVAILAIGATNSFELYGASRETDPVVADQGGRAKDRRWYRAQLNIDPHGAVSAEIESIDDPTGAHHHWSLKESPATVGAAPASPVHVVLGAATDPRTAESPHKAFCFNGRVADPIVRFTALSEAQDTRGGQEWTWLLGNTIGAVHRPDTTGTVAFTLRNAPTDALRGPNWSGRWLHFQECPDEYGALGFHEDDLEDAGWDTSAEISLPDNVSSGVYAARLTAGDQLRYVPFFVRPALSGTRAKIALIMPTFTYMAYANEHMRETDLEGTGVFEAPVVHPHDVQIERHREFGLSLYDRHRDGTGVCLSSTRRPILNLAPDYRVWMDGAPRHLAADLYLVDWLEHFGYEYDILTDHAVHEHGPEALRGYSVLITGGHPEYTSESLLDAVEGHVRAGGGLMYLGGNGHYWVTSVDPERPHLIEIRRGQAGTRTWECESGEGHHASSGEPGGLWRHRDRPPNRLLGVGFTSQGWDTHAPGFHRVLEEGTEWEWVFDGVASPEAFGTEGLVMGGASGDELDRFAVENGSPEETVWLGTSNGHSNYYQLVIEDLLMTYAGQGGRNQPLVRSDMVIVPGAEGGGVFSVGSIAWSGSLSWDGYENDVSRITRNVLDHYLASG